MNTILQINDIRKENNNVVLHLIDAEYIILYYIARM